MTDPKDPKDELDPQLLEDLKAAMAQDGPAADLPEMQLEGRDFDTVVVATDKTDKD